MSKEVVAVIIMSFATSVILCPVIIPFLQRLKLGQYIREEGPKRHLKKTGTPTMGGLIILAAIVITSMAFIKDNKEITPVLFMTLGYGLIGFLDDYIKIVMKRNLGLKSWQKMTLQVLFAAVFAYYLTHYTDIGTSVIIPFTDGMTLELGELYMPFIFIVIIGTVNGTNFTDGLDVSKISSVYGSYYY
ncbi:MAG: phospho-N-acetylmuramoyl-pentapeptide-transferase, partial [Lachnospiraceae bacterium]